MIPAGGLIHQCAIKMWKSYVLEGFEVRTAWMLVYKVDFEVQLHQGLRSAGMNAISWVLVGYLFSSQVVMYQCHAILYEVEYHVWASDLLELNVLPTVRFCIK